jgi:hypothetical protein
MTTHIYKQGSLVASFNEPEDAVLFLIEKEPLSERNVKRSEYLLVFDEPGVPRIAVQR